MAGASVSTATAARMLGVSPNTLRSWDRRYGFPSVLRRSEGGHRRFLLRDVRALQDALGEGLRGDELVARGLELAASGRYEMPGMHERIELLERTNRKLVVEVVRMRRALEILLSRRDAPL